MGSLADITRSKPGKLLPKPDNKLLPTSGYVCQHLSKIGVVGGVPGDRVLSD